jgi:hypothetical protein
VPEGTEALSAKLGAKFRDAISLSETFVYAASFISPVLYLVIQRYITSAGGRGASVAEQVRRNLAGLFRGYVLIWVLALLVLITTAVAFAAQKSDAAGFKETFLAGIGEAFAPALYLFSLLCWYLTLCDEFVGDFDYSDESRASENEAVGDFKKRLQHRKAGE